MSQVFGNLSETDGQQRVARWDAPVARAASLTLIHGAGATPHAPACSPDRARTSGLRLVGKISDAQAQQLNGDETTNSSLAETRTLAFPGAARTSLVRFFLLQLRLRWIYR